MRVINYTNPNAGSITFSYNPYLITSLKGLDLAKINNQTQKGPYQDGATPIDQLFEVREVVLEGAINAPQNLVAIDGYKRAMLSALNPKAGPGILYYTNNIRTYRLKNVVADGPIYSNKEATSPFQTFQITFYCNDPYLYDSSDTNTALGSSTAITNSGDVNMPYVLVIAGPCTNPVITNSTSGKSISYSGSLTSSQYLTISTAYGNIYATLNTNGTVTNAMASFTSTTTFFSLGLGISNINKSASSGTPIATMTYSPRYIGA